MKLTVYHDGQFWVGVVEVVEDGKLKAGRYVFGAEPKDSEILDSVDRSTTATRVKVNPKRLAGHVSREVQNKGISTYAQDAMKLENENRKQERQLLSRQHREEEKERKREIARQKSKEKHRGR